jgi:hypothetical protein
MCADRSLAILTAFETLRTAMLTETLSAVMARTLIARGECKFDWKDLKALEVIALFDCWIEIIADVKFEIYSFVRNFTAGKRYVENEIRDGCVTFCCR